LNGPGLARQAAPRTGRFGRRAKSSAGSVHVVSSGSFAQLPWPRDEFFVTDESANTAGEDSRVPAGSLQKDRSGETIVEAMNLAVVRSMSL